jgi:2,3,4,5-tetrahydropyridine-2-carboxylate N-succinyltransferase
MTINTKKEFKNSVNIYRKNHKKPYISALAQVYRNTLGDVIAVKYLTINVETQDGTAAVLGKYFQGSGKKAFEQYPISPYQAKDILKRSFGPFIKNKKKHDNIEALKFSEKENIELCVVFVKNKNYLLKKKIANLYDASLRLSLISRRYYKPNTLNLDGCFGALPNLVWTNKGVHTIEDWNSNWFSAQLNGEEVLCQDRFAPIYWANPVLPDVRIANTAMVRNGAYLGSGTTVMHYGFVNFNAGSLGASMIEGTIPSGSTVDEGTDVGARAGMLGTLSGGNSTNITIGKNCLLGVDSETGIPLGDNVLVKEGTVFSGGTPICVIEWKKERSGKFKVDDNKKPIIKKEKIVKASTLSNISNVTFRVNSQTGRMEVIPVPNKVQLNELLHQNSD